MLHKKIPQEARLAYKGKMFEVWEWDQEMFDGTYEVFEMIRRNNSSIIIPITKDGLIIVNYEEQPHRGKFISLPGGFSEDGEDIDLNAKRELLEETGYTSNEWEMWFENDVLGYSKMEWFSYCYIARNCEKTGDTKFDPGEKIETKLLTLDEFINIIQDPLFRNYMFKKMDPEEIRRKILG